MLLTQESLQQLRAKNDMGYTSCGRRSERQSRRRRDSMGEPVWTVVDFPKGSAFGAGDELNHFQGPSVFIHFFEDG